ncbi:fungal-specific transcription factor domain-containing protein, partial [Mucidula mucida]
MPAEPRRRQKVFTEEELKDIEQKRIRGELSCAECRRLKLKCDKKVPCGSCCRRGCESICPCGILSAGQGTRFVLADTDHLHRKITDMSTRIRQLEDALAILQASVSSDRHPLLNDDLLRVKFGAEAAKQQQAEPLLPPENQAIDALGTLTLTDAGDMRYFGRSAGSERFEQTLIAGEEWEELSDLDANAEMSGIPDYTVSFPFSSHPVPIPDLVRHLPSLERAQLLSQSYIDHASLFFRPIKSDELFNSFLPKVYGDPTSLASESLAMLFFILALGALFDLTLSPYNKEAELYYKLGTSALSVRPALDTPQIDTVRAVGLLATYHSMASKKYSRDSAWCSMSLAAKLAQSVNRDSARWGMDATTVQIRRTLWWEVFSSDVSHSLALGRPPSIHQSFADCEFPTDEEATLSDSGEIEYGFWRMKYTFARDIFSAVVDATLTAKSPSYTTVLDLDKKVRQMSFPSSVKPYVKLEDSEEDYYSSAKSLRDFYASQHRTVTMLYLHRSFFAQSILDHPSNPLLSPFAPSFLTAFRSASILIKAAAHQFDRCANMAMRVWFLLYHIFSSAIIVGCVVTRSPTSNIAPGALLDLELAIRIFEHSSAQSGRAKIALGVLRKLKDKAVRSYSQSQGKSVPREPDSSDQQSSSASPLSAKQDDDSEDELAIFGGQTKVLTKSHRSKHRSQYANSPGSASSDSSTSPP